MGTLALIGLGSNLGDRKAILDGAVASLSETPGIEVRAVSSYHETAPVGGPGQQEAFLNAAAVVEVNCEPSHLLGRLQEIELICGRRREVHWGARTLDLDILLFGDRIIGRHPKLSQLQPRPDQPLRVPHPWLAIRRFVLAPAAEVAPDAVDPVTGRTISGLLANLDRRPSYLALAGHDGPLMQRCFRRITQSLGAVGFSRGVPSWEQIASREAFRHARDRAKREPIGESNFDWRERLEQAFGFHAEALRASRWTEALWGDRWIVTDFWLEQWCGFMTNNSFGRLASGQDAIRPTFVAILPPFDREFLVRCDQASAPDRIRERSMGPLPPIFTYRPDLPSIQAEDQEARDSRFIDPILAACEASRSGLK